jgi:uncharacterized MAPEG superfamily protein
VRDKPSLRSAVWTVALLINIALLFAGKY